MAPAQTHTQLGDTVFGQIEKTNSELLALIYGSLITQLLKDIDDVGAVNEALDRLGYDIGIRLIEEFLAKTQITHCENFEETCNVIAKVGFKIFLGVEAEVIRTESQGAICYIKLETNPLNEFVELPPSLENLEYGGFICGVIRGALEQLQMRVRITITQNTLRNDDFDEFKLELVELLKETFVDLEES
eukprot:Gregarina_sp_Pseudo_9__825@NODE_1528_length_1523_cov_83_560647_g1416_i0_p1_GENE_NODE_1528_length_1523_cov_83_560647_g1416_i0NODE_1528_length_1523_cov_83_560647_g1416_i0_p1_ORF_typecomplete_len199_score30_85TRAPP/PF04051_16/4e32DUF3583/PF12126_8/0_21_NODE_1528_length_1523_cov_83_560647_g1416_i09251491